MNVTALLAEISALRREVHAITQLKVEVDQLKTLLSSNVSSGRQESSDASLSITENPASKSFADLAFDLKAAAATGPILTAHAQKKKSNVKPVVGSSTANKRVTSVKTTRSVDIFVSRLQPDTSADSLIDCVQSMSDGIEVVNVECTQLKSKYE